jgi:hypothetical protein
VFSVGATNNHVRTPTDDFLTKISQLANPDPSLSSLGSCGFDLVDESPCALGAAANVPSLAEDLIATGLDLIEDHRSWGVHSNDSFALFLQAYGAERLLHRPDLVGKRAKPCNQ